MYDLDFWGALEELVRRFPPVVDRPKGSAHPRYPSIRYPLDYGYLNGSTSTDGEGVDVWLGSAPNLGLTAVICTVDLGKGDSELKLLLGCTREEEQTVLAFHNQNQFVRGMLISRPAFF